MSTLTEINELKAQILTLQKTCATLEEKLDLTAQKAIEKAATHCVEKAASIQAEYDRTENPFIRTSMSAHIAILQNIATEIRGLS
jgi:hypothetical protein